MCIFNGKSYPSMQKNKKNPLFLTANTWKEQTMIDHNSNHQKKNGAFTVAEWKIKHTLNAVLAPQIINVSLQPWCLWFPLIPPGRISPTWTEAQFTAPPANRKQSHSIFPFPGVSKIQNFDKFSLGNFLSNQTDHLKWRHRSQQKWGWAATLSCQWRSEKRTSPNWLLCRGLGFEMRCDWEESWREKSVGVWEIAMWGGGRLRGEKGRLEASWGRRRERREMGLGFLKFDCWWC